MSEKEKLKNAVLRCLDAGYGELVSMEPIERFIKNREKAKNEALANAEKALDEFGQHGNKCILSYGHQGRPTADGGYEVQYGDKWYQTLPIDRTPKCQCGLSEAIAELRRVSGKI